MCVASSVVLSVQLILVWQDTSKGMMVQARFVVSAVCLGCVPAGRLKVWAVFLQVD